MPQPQPPPTTPARRLQPLGGTLLDSNGFSRFPPPATPSHPPGRRLQPLDETLLATAAPLNTSPLARRLQPLGETLLAPAASAAGRNTF
ncbi:MAG: hypothetical protein ACO3NW_03840 [Kiritimatiellia bacterium]